MGRLLSAFCDGEASPAEVSAVREHLRACAGCRSALRTYRAAPRAAAALAPTLPVSRSLFERAHDALGSLYARLPGGSDGSDSVISQVAAAGGTRGAGMAALAKVLAICAGTAGGAAACVAAGVVPAPLDLGPDRPKPAIERSAGETSGTQASAAVEYEPAPAEPTPEPQPPKPQRESKPAPAPEPAPASAGAVEYTPEAAAAVAAPSSGSSSGSAAGEFGP